MGKAIVVIKDEIKQLSSRERMLLADLERRIVSEFSAFHRVGMALAEINERQLYRETHPTFESYCKNLWDMARGTAYRYIAAAEVFENVSKLETNTEETMPLLPMTESQVRPLTRLRPEQQVVVWRQVVDYAGPGRKITASLVNKAVKGFLGEKAAKGIRKVKEKARLAPVSAEFLAAYAALADQVGREMDADYKLTPRGEIIKYLDQLRAEVAMDGAEIEGPAFHGGSDDTNKLLRAGYRLFRTDRSSMTVKEHGGTGWKKHSGPFGTIKEMDEELKTILQDEKHLRG